jgi:hypothetical protein
VTAIRAIFDGQSFVPQQPVSLPNQSQAWVVVEQDDAAAMAQLDQSVRAYYTQAAAASQSDINDEDWGKAVSPKSHKAWDED